VQLAVTLDKLTRSFPILERRLGGLPESLPKLSLRQLRVFETVARLENVSGASKELLRSQPAVTSSILRLEQLLGSPCRARNHRTYRPRQASRLPCARENTERARARH